MKPLRIAIIGYGKIAHDQHAPAIAANPRFELAATVTSKPEPHPGIPSFKTHQEMLKAVPDLDVVTISTPPSVRYDIARDCLEAGLHAMLEKPPTVTLGEIDELARIAKSRDVTLFTTWHAQANPPVEAAQKILAGKKVRTMKIVWREDVRKWHPGQQWIWEAAGFGVFDPGINALSIASRIFPDTLFVRQAELFIPSNKQSPIAADLRLASPAASGEMSALFDWRHSGGEEWTITVETSDGRQVKLADGGGTLLIDGARREVTGLPEYPALYARFVDLIDCRQSQVDVQPLRLVADAFLLATRTAVDPFVD